MTRTKVAVRHHSGNITVTITRHGDAHAYVHDMYADGRAKLLHLSIESAQAEADAVVREVGHVCGDGCSGWQVPD